MAAQSACRQQRPQSAFTLIELLVVIGIITLLLGMLLPSLSHARDIAKYTTEVATLKNAATSIEIYKIDNKALPETSRGPAPYRYRVNSEELLSALNYSPENWTDPFGRVQVEKLPIFGNPGLRFRNQDHPTDGHGRLYLDMVTKNAVGQYVISGGGGDPINYFNINIFHNAFGSPLKLPSDTQYAIWSSGNNGEIDLDVEVSVRERDIIFVGTESEGLRQLTKNQN